MAQAEAPAEGGVALLLYLTLVSALMWMLFRALKAGWQLTLGGVLDGLGNALNYDYRFIHIHFGGPILALNHAILNALTKAALGYEKAMGFWFHEMAHLQLWIVDETWKLARDLYHLGGWTIHTYVPSLIHGATHATTTTVRTVVKQTTVVERKAVAVARDVTIPHLGEIQWLHRHWRALTHAVAVTATLPLHLPRTLENLWHGIDDLRRWRVTTNKRLHKLEAAAGAVAFAGLMGNAMGVPWRCLRPRGPIGKLARSLCGAPTWLLDFLVVGAVEAFVVSDLCEFADLLRAEATAIRPALMELVDAENALVGCHGATAPRTFSLPPVSLPDLVGAVSLAA